MNINKKVVFLLILIYSNLICFGQKISITELTKLYTLDWDYFDTYVLTKGYEYSSSKEDDKIAMKSYAFNEITADTKASRFITKYVDKFSYRELVTWQTSKKTEYLWFKSQIVSNKFKYVESGQFKNSTFLKYKKDNLTLRLYVSKMPDANGKDIPIYEISLSNKD